MKVIYRTSDAGYNKVKPDYIDNEKCLENFRNRFKNPDIIIADNVKEEDHLHQIKMIPDCQVHETNLGSGAASFRYALDLIKKSEWDDGEIVYIVENDYLHVPDSLWIMLEGFNLGADYVSLYDHPDKYINKDAGGNPFVEDGGEVTRVFRGETRHWKLTNSTTMTMAAKKKTFLEDYNIMQEFIGGTYPRDFDMFLKLRDNGRSLITPLPGAATHGETQWLSPFRRWELV